MYHDNGPGGRYSYRCRFADTGELVAAMDGMEDDPSREAVLLSCRVPPAAHAVLVSRLWLNVSLERSVVGQPRDADRGTESWSIAYDDAVDHIIACLPFPPLARHLPASVFARADQCPILRASAPAHEIPCSAGTLDEFRAGLHMRVALRRRRLSMQLHWSGQAPLRHLVEWLEFHLLAGIEHFYVYISQDLGASEAVLRDYAHRGLVTVVIWPAGRQSHPVRSRLAIWYNWDAKLRSLAATDSLYRFRDDTEWLLPGMQLYGP